MKIIVTGANGQLGTDVCTELRKKGHTVIPADLPFADITDKAVIENFITENRPDAVIHLAAYTAVDKAEKEEKDLCNFVNTTGTENVAVACGKLDIPILYTSSDYVFPGTGNDFYETDSPVMPCNHYGKTKLNGENSVRKYCRKHFIVRISWVFGVHGKNFVYTMLRLSESRDTINVVNDQVGSPTFTPDLAKLIGEMIVTDKYGTYHATNEGICSWSEFAQAIMKESGRKAVINPIKTKDYPTAAKRPLNSRMSKCSLDEAGFSRLPDWEDALHRFISQVLDKEQL